MTAIGHWQQNQRGRCVSDAPLRMQDASVLTWHRLSPAGRSKTHFWRQSEAWWDHFSPWASDRPQRCPATYCVAKTAAEKRGMRHVLMWPQPVAPPALPGNERFQHICGQTPGRWGWHGPGRPSSGSRMQLLPGASSHLVKDTLLMLEAFKGKTCGMWVIAPSCPWQMSVRSAPSTMNFGLVQISWRAEAAEKASQ